MMCRPAGRLATGPLPPADFAARFFAAVMRPPLLFLAMVIPLVEGEVMRGGLVAGGEQDFDATIAAGLGVTEGAGLDAIRGDARIDQRTAHRGDAALGEGPIATIGALGVHRAIDAN